jgi:hypothetical protein
MVKKQIWVLDGEDDPPLLVLGTMMLAATSRDPIQLLRMRLRWTISAGRIDESARDQREPKLKP